MRASALITVTAISAIAVAVLLLTQLPQPPAKAPASAPPASAPAPAVATVAQPQPETPPPTAPVAARAEADAHPAETGKQDAAPNAKAEETAAAESVGDDADSAEAGADEAGDTEGDEPDASTSIDVGRAADLLADWMAKQDAMAGNEGEAPPQSVQSLRTFDQEGSDANWSEPTTQQIEAALNAWLNGLPDEVRDHIEVIHVECRETLCQILAADNELAMQNDRAQASQEWQQAIATLPQQPWWSELGFVDLTTAVDSDADSGYVLYQTYLRREVKPAG